jgi:hypothetical protein
MPIRVADDGEVVQHVTVNLPTLVSMTTATPHPEDLVLEHEELMRRARELPGVAVALDVQRAVDEALPMVVTPLVAGVGYATGANR